MAVEDWLMAPIRRIVPDVRPVLHQQLVHAGLVTEDVVQSELSATATNRKALNRYAAFPSTFPSIS